MQLQVFYINSCSMFPFSQAFRSKCQHVRILAQTSHPPHNPKHADVTLECTLSSIQQVILVILDQIPSFSLEFPRAYYHDQWGLESQSWSCLRNLVLFKKCWQFLTWQNLKHILVREFFLKLSQVRPIQTVICSYIITTCH